MPRLGALGPEAKSPEAKSEGVVVKARRTRARRFATLVTLTTGLSLVGLMPGAVSASVATISQRDCDALLLLPGELPEGGASIKEFDPDAFDSLATGYTTTAKKIQDKKLKKALLTIADVYEEMADQDDLASAIAVTAARTNEFTKALTRLTKATLKCATTSLTIPTLPRNVTIPSLPGNVTIPSLPR